MPSDPEDIDWKKEPARLHLLAHFLTPQTLDKLAIPPATALAAKAAANAPIHPPLRYSLKFVRVLATDVDSP